MGRFSGGKRFAGTVYPFINDFFSVLGRQVASITAFLLTGVAFQALGFILMFQILLALSQNSSELVATGWISVSGVEISSGITLKIAVLMFLISLVAGSLSLYSGKRRILRVGLAYEKICTKRLIKAWHRDPVEFKADLKVAGAKELMGLLTRDVRICGRAARILIAAVHPLLLLFFLTFFLLYLNPMWTGLVFIGLSLTGYLMLEYFAAGARAAFSLEATAVASKQIKHDLVFGEGDRPDHNTDLDTIVETEFLSGPLAENFEAYHERLAFQIRNGMLAEIAGIALLAVLLAYGAASLHLPGEIATVIAFAVALRFLVANLRLITAAVAALVRFFPSLERYFNSRYLETQ